MRCKSFFAAVRFTRDRTEIPKQLNLNSSVGKRGKHSLESKRVLETSWMPVDSNSRRYVALEKKRTKKKKEKRKREKIHISKRSRKKRNYREPFGINPCKFIEISPRRELEWKKTRVKETFVPSFNNNRLCRPLQLRFVRLGNEWQFVTFYSPVMENRR